MTEIQFQVGLGSYWLRPLFKLQGNLSWTWVLLVVVPIQGATKFLAMAPI